MVYARPYYSVAINVKGCGYDIRINDCPLQAHRRRSVSCVQPLNEWLVDGRNLIRARLMPFPGEETLRADSELTLQVFVREDGIEANELVEELLFRGGAAQAGKGSNPVRAHSPLTVIRDGQAVVLELPIGVTVPFPPWAWSSAPPIAPVQSTLDSLLRQLDELHARFTAHDLDAVVARSEERNRERAVAYYFTVQDTVEGQHDSYQELLSEPGLRLQPLRREGLHLNLYGEGRLANVTTARGEPTLYYATDDGSLIGEILFLFRKDRSGRWIVAR